MFSFRGNTSSLAFTSQANLPTVLNSVVIVNKAATSTTVNVYHIGSNFSISIAPLNMAMTAGQMYESDNPIVLLASEQIKIQTSGSIDYNLTLDNLEP